MENRSIWNCLQEPSCLSGLPAGYLLLLSAVDTGWRITEPVRMQSGPDDDSQSSYAFVLTHSRFDTSTELVVPQSHTVDTFIHDEGLKVVENYWL